MKQEQYPEITFDNSEEDVVIINQHGKRDYNTIMVERSHFMNFLKILTRCPPVYPVPYTICENCGINGWGNPEAPYVMNKVQFDGEDKVKWLCYNCNIEVHPEAKPYLTKPLEIPVITKNKKVYLAGKVTGLNRLETSQKFGQHEVKLMRQGYDVITPLNIVDKDSTWLQAMRICIAAMMDCETIYFMPCYADSPGAVIEHELALKLGMTIKYL